MTTRSCESDDEARWREAATDRLLSSGFYSLVRVGACPQGGMFMYNGFFWQGTPILHGGYGPIGCTELYLGGRHIRAKSSRAFGYYQEVAPVWPVNMVSTIEEAFEAAMIWDTQNRLSL